MKFDKYKYYIKSVQEPISEIEFFEKVWKELRGKTKPKTLREDFCGTFILCCEWVKSKPDRVAIGVDLDSTPLDYGLKNHFSKLDNKQKKRITLINKNVLSFKTPCVDIINASNFSYFIFKKRKDLYKYFLNAKKCLNDSGLFIIDCFGGSDCFAPNEESTKHENFTYYWDQDSYNPITNEAKFYIHFRLSKKRVNKVFTYDWRMWSIPELRDILYDVGFSKTNVYWEGTDENGEGDGVFSKTELGEACESWVSYIVAEK